jgi:ankyrin repeat protein
LRVAFSAARARSALLGRADSRLANLDAALRLAAENNIVNALEFLLDLGVSPNPEQPEGESTPLMLACARGGRAARLLLERGAQPNPPGRALRPSGSALHVAIFSRHDDLVGPLIAAGADVRFARKSDGNTPLHCAADDGQSIVVQQLLAAGADVMVENSNGATPLAIVEQRFLREASRYASVRLALREANSLARSKQAGNAP